MNHTRTTINPFFAARRNRVETSIQSEPSRPIYARLPIAPKNASPVPHLTSLYHFHRAGDYGDRSWPGNCGGNLIKDLLNYFKPSCVRPNGWQRDGTRRLRGTRHRLLLVRHPPGIRRLRSSRLPRGQFLRIHLGPSALLETEGILFDPRDLSRVPSLEEFLRRYRLFIRNCARSLKPGGKLAILMGDYSDREAGYVPLVFHTKRLAFEAGLSQHCTDIIRFSHGASSSRKVYRSSFIPGLHDVCMIFEKTK